jgi:hypothetical protein
VPATDAPVLVILLAALLFAMPVESVFSNT